MLKSALGTSLNVKCVEFLTSAPPGISVWVDVRRPCLQSSFEVVAKGTELGGDDSCDLVYQLIVESSTCQDWLGEGCSVAPLALLFELYTVLLGYSVESLVPPDVGWESNARRAGLVLIGVGELFFQGHGLDQGCRSGQWVCRRVANGVVAQWAIDTVWEESSCSVCRALSRGLTGENRQKNLKTQCCRHCSKR